MNLDQTKLEELKQNGFILSKNANNEDQIILASTPINITGNQTIVSENSLNAASFSLIGLLNGFSSFRIVSTQNNNRCWLVKTDAVIFNKSLLLIGIEGDGNFFVIDDSAAKSFVLYKSQSGVQMLSEDSIKKISLKR